MNRWIIKSTFVLLFAFGGTASARHEVEEGILDKIPKALTWFETAPVQKAMRALTRLGVFGRLGMPDPHASCRGPDETGWGYFSCERVSVDNNGKLHTRPHAHKVSHLNYWGSRFSQLALSIGISGGWTIIQLKLLQGWLAAAGMPLLQPDVFAFIVTSAAIPIGALGLWATNPDIKD